jgi:trypsin
LPHSSTWFPFWELPLFALLLACSGEMSTPVTSSTGAPSADQVLPPAGVQDRSDDPAVVAIDVGGRVVCSGALVAPDIVLTARRCVAVTALQTECPAGPSQIVTTLAPQSIRILVGDKVTSAQERARGREIVAPPGDVLCGADIALVLLDTPIDEIQPLSVRATGAARGDHLRTVGFVRLGGASVLDKLVRDHLAVFDATATELRIGEGCHTSAGGPAIDESTAEIVGVASRGGGSTCTGGSHFDVYTRADAFLWFVGDALARSGFVASSSGSTKGKEKTKKGPVDMGANCARGDDCAAGVCVTAGSQEYCSRTCDPHDRCPARFRCKRPEKGAWVCVE